MFQVRALSKRHGPQILFEDLNFTWSEAGIYPIMGPSGSGKTSLLRVLAAWEQPNSGQILWQGQDLKNWPLHQRPTHYLSQQPLLFPHLNLSENLALALSQQPLTRREKQQHIDFYLAQLGLEAQAQHKPDMLSGGQLQRAALGRALLLKPKVLLADEPFSALDPPIRRQMQALLRQFVDETQSLCLFVSHDLREALSLGQRFHYLKQGQLLHFESLSQWAAFPDSGLQDALDFWKNIKPHDEGQSFD